MNAEQIAKLKELAQAASIDLPVEHDDYSSIRSKTGNFVVYDEGGATEEQARYVIELINLAPELIAAAERTTSPDRQSCCGHDSDCAVHNAPALPVGPCDCSLAAAAPHSQAPAEQQERVHPVDLSKLNQYSTNAVASIGLDDVWLKKHDVEQLFAAAPAAQSQSDESGLPG